MEYVLFLAGAFFFSLLGFCLHAIFFNRARIVQCLTESNMALREGLRRKETEVQDKREEMEWSARHVKILENQLGQRNLELNDLYHEMLRSEERIALLEKRVADAFPGRKETESYDDNSPISDHPSNSDNLHPFTGSAETKGDLVRLKGKGHAARRSQEPLWRKKLNTVLDVLNEIEK